MDAISPIGIYSCVLLAMSAVVIIVGWRLRDKAYPPMRAVIFALSPGFICMGLFWSLALHMYLKLGDWPLGIGYAELDGLLVVHAKAAFSYFWQILVLSILILPAPCVISSVVRRWRGLLIYHGLYASGIAIATLMMFLAPSGFQNWWWD